MGKLLVAKTPAEFEQCFSSGEPFEASEELAAQFGFSPIAEAVVSDEEFFAPADANSAGRH